MKSWILFACLLIGASAFVASCTDAPTDTTTPPQGIIAPYDVSLIPADQARFPNRPGTATLLSVPLASLVDNGGFETDAAGNTFTDWTEWNAGTGSWYVQAGTVSPYSGFSVPAPPSGTNAAMSDQPGPGTHILWQDVAIPAGGASLSFKLFIANRASIWAHPATLWYTTYPNQQARVDVMDPAATTLSLSSSDILLQVFTTTSTDPLVMSGYVTKTANLDALAGQTVRLRFSEVDNSLWFQMGVDDVTVTPRAYVDIKPDSDPNPVNISANGTLVVAILTDEVLDAADVDVSTVRLGDGSGTETGVKVKNNGTLQYGYEDADGDGDDDLVMHFSIPDLVNNGDLTSTSTRLILTGTTDSDVIFDGWDTVAPQ